MKNSIEDWMDNEKGGTITLAKSRRNKKARSVTLCIPWYRFSENICHKCLLTCPLKWKSYFQFQDFELQSADVYGLLHCGTTNRSLQQKFGLSKGYLRGQSLLQLKGPREACYESSIYIPHHQIWRTQNACIDKNYFLLNSMRQSPSHYETSRKSAKRSDNHPKIKLQCTRYLLSKTYFGITYD